MNNYIKIVLAMLIWSTWGLMIRWIALPPVVVLFATSLFAGFMVPLTLKGRGEFPPSFLSFESWQLFIALAIASLGNNLTYFYALGHTTISNAVFTHYTAPIIVAILAPFMLAERLLRVTLISLPIAVIGMVLIVLAGGPLSLNSDHLPGIIAGSLSGVAYSFVIIYSRRISQMLLDRKAIIVLLWITIAATAPAALSAECHLTMQSCILLLITGVFHSTIAPLMYFSALRHVFAQHAAILGYIEPLAAIPFAFVFLSEIPSLTALIGGLMILFSGYLVVHERNRS